MGHEPQTDAAEQGITTPSRQWLESFRDTAEARRVAELEARLAGDIDLVTRLMYSGYQGQDWEEAASWLARYGLRVMTAWILDGTIVRHCKAKELAAPWTSRCHDRQEAEMLAADTVSEALIRFRDDVLKPGIWHPDRGASLSSFFVGQCLIRWGNVFKRWHRGLRDVPAGDGAVFDRRVQPDESSRVVNRIYADGILARESELVGRITSLRAGNFEWEEISSLTNKTVGQLRGVYVRFQAKVDRSGEVAG